jgi:hypothetical protein
LRRVALPHVENKQAYIIYLTTLNVFHVGKNCRITNEKYEGEDLEGKITVSVKETPPIIALRHRGKRLKYFQSKPSYVETEIGTGDFRIQSRNAPH